MSFVLDVPVQLLMTFLLALPAGEKVEIASDVVNIDKPAPIVRVQQGFGEGPFKFREQTWLAALKFEQKAPSFTHYSRRIFHTSNGFHYVPNAQEREAILALRAIPAIAQGVAARLAQRNAKHLRRALGRAAGASELYLAHRLGASSAVVLIRAITARPSDPAYFHVAKAAPDFPVEALLPNRTMTLAGLKNLVDQSVAVAKQRARDQKLLQRFWRPSLRNSLAAIVASSGRATDAARIATRLKKTPLSDR